ncbi:hypothetical protein GCM10010439_19160 [Actinocorallia aurantiaca]|uniref:Uncharacterized protein n=1 Tax=Actinocorallia aurantiaca TaxID=46204 RepID=A0ABP6GL60_9ACTN
MRVIETAAPAVPRRLPGPAAPVVSASVVPAVLAGFVARSMDEKVETHWSAKQIHSDEEKKDH